MVTLETESWRLYIFGKDEDEEDEEDEEDGEREEREEEEYELEEDV